MSTVLLRAGLPENVKMFDYLVFEFPFSGICLGCSNLDFLFDAPYFLWGRNVDIRNLFLTNYSSRVRNASFALEKTYDIQPCEGPAGG